MKQPAFPSLQADFRKRRRRWRKYLRVLSALLALTGGAIISGIGFSATLALAQGTEFAPQPLWLMLILAALALTLSLILWEAS